MKIYYFIIFLEVIVAVVTLDFQKRFWSSVAVLICLIIVAVLSIVKERESDKDGEAMKETLLEIKVSTDESTRGIKTLVKKSEKTYPDNKNEAKIKIGLQGTFSIIEGYNVEGSVTDAGLGKIEIYFKEMFKDEFYEVRMRGNKGEIEYNNVVKEKTSLRIEYEEEDLEWIEIICWER